jgi:ATPase subunit of ABC transporter with duplicated ATPase domains
MTKLLVCVKRTLDVAGADSEGKTTLLQLIATSLAKGHRKVAAQRTLMLLYRYEEAAEAYLTSMKDVLNGSKPAEAARMRRASIEWAGIFRGW